MSEIPFVNRLGDAIDAAIVRETAARADDRATSRSWFPGLGAVRSRRGAAVVLAVLAIGGGAAALAQTLQSPTALVAGGIACYAGTGTGAPSAYFDIEANGRSPQTACAQVFRTDGPARLGLPGVTLVPCADPHGYVAVFQSTGAAGQCHSQGMSALAPRPYAAAEVRVDRLVDALARIGASRPCIAPSTLVRDVQAELDRRGWSGWRARLQEQPAGQGACGMFQATGSSASDPTASLDAGHRVVWVVSGPIPSLVALTGPLDLKLLQASGRGCYTPAGARGLVRKALASANVEIRFLLTREPPDGQMAYAQRAYDRGCTIVRSVWAAPYGRVVDAWLNSRTARPAPTASPSQGAFMPPQPASATR